MSTTSEQQAPIDYLLKHEGLVMVNAIAGSGKTHLLVEASKQLPVQKALYLAYTKSIATEASRKFPSATVECRTTHSLAYQRTVNLLGLKLGYFNYKAIKDRITYEDKLTVISHVEKFCLSKHLDFDSYTEEYQIDPGLADIAVKHLDYMYSAKIDCTHYFYLKVFHQLLASGHIVYDELDLLMLDEAGDLNEVTLEIFLLLPAKRKIAVGDKHQNIFSFNHTVNAFKLLEGQGKEFSLTKSWRVSSHIANDIQRFCSTYMDSNMEFSGITYSNLNLIESKGYITRTNSALIGKMIELNASNTPYALVRPASAIFKTALMVCYFKKGGEIKDKEYSHLQEELNDWYKTNPTGSYGKLLTYLKIQHSDDIGLTTALSVVLTHTSSAVIEAHKIAKSHEKSHCNYILATAHSVKGLEMDEVYIADDLNSSVEDLLPELIGNPNYVKDQEEIDSLNLYYVACSRARKNLVNAIHLTNLKEL
jgi:hypothetical protein